MKTRILIMGLTVSLASLAAVQVAAGFGPEKGPGKGKAGKGNKPPQAAIEKFDADGDGKLSQEERKTAFETRRQEMLDKYDADGDGKLSPEERKAAAEDGARIGPPHGKGKGARGKGAKGKGAKGKGAKGKGKGGKGKGAKGKGGKGGKGGAEEEEDDS